MKIAAAGIGYVGLSMAVLLSQHHTVIAVDVLPQKAAQINQRIRDAYIEKYLSDRRLCAQQRPLPDFCRKMR